MRKRLAKSFNCPTEFTLQVLGGKWKTVILCYLKERPLRYAELRQVIPALSDKMLSQRLHDLVDIGLVTRNRIEEGVEVYVLTAKGESLGGLLAQIYNWGKMHAASFGVNVGEPLNELDKAS
jgi:DNA-binding HxlR family transcriptional regulator